MRVRDFYYLERLFQGGEFFQWTMLAWLAEILNHLQLIYKLTKNINKKHLYGVTL